LPAKHQYFGVDRTA